jgi:hypothetical protein
VGGSHLKTVRQGPEDGCLFNAQGAYRDSYPCSPSTVLAGASALNGTATLVFTPAAQAMAVSGLVQFDSPLIQPGSFELSHLKSAVFKITKPGSAKASWLAQSGPGIQTTGALKLLVTTAQPLLMVGSDTTYLVHGVFEALLVSVEVGQSVSGDVVLHGEF